MGNKINVTAFSAACTYAVFRYTPEYAPRNSVILTFIPIFFASLFALFTWTIVIYQLYFNPLRHLPHPSGGSWLMGQFGEIYRRPSGEPQKDWIEQVPHDGIIYYRGALNADRIMPTSPKAISEVLVTKSYEFIKPENMRRGLGRILGIGILLAEGDEHKRQRKLLMPAFQYRHVKDLYPVFWEKSREMVEAIEKSITASDKAESISEWVSRATLDIIGVAGMGQDFEAIKDPNGELCTTYRKVLEPSSATKILGVLALFIPMQILRLLPLKRNKDDEEAIVVIKRTARNLIRSKKAKMEKGQSSDVDIISVALNSGGFSDEDLVNQLMTFLAAGHETTASSMAWAGYVLSRNPEIQTRLRNEIRKDIPSISSGAAITVEDIDRCAYLAAVCNEILRLHPPVTMTVRVAGQDSSIQGTFIPKGTTIFVPIWAINTHKDLWGPDANDFNPDRWMAPGQANSGGASNNFAMTTFLHGPRSCIGQAFAKAEFQILLAALIGRFELKPADLDVPLDIVGGVTQKPKGGVPVYLKAVDGW